MQVFQTYEVLNTAFGNETGVTTILSENLENFTDWGTDVLNNMSLDKACDALVDHIGKVVVVNRVYKGRVPSVLRDGWEYGYVLQKIRIGMPTATINETWELEDGTSVDQYVYHKPNVAEKFYAKRQSFEIEHSVADKQLKGAFSNASQMQAFIAALFTAVENAYTKRIEIIVKRTINNFIGETLYAEAPDGVYSGRSGFKAVNLLELYNAEHPGTPLTKAQAIKQPEALRDFAYNFMVQLDLMSGMSVDFNIGGQERFTSEEDLHIVMLSSFEKALRVYLYDANGQFNTSNLKLDDNIETVPQWQGTSTGSFEDLSKIDITTSNGHEISISGVVAVAFDRDALGISNLDRRTTSAYCAKGEFTNYFHKCEVGSWNDENENFIVFYLA